MIMVNGSLGKAQARVLKTLDHLDANGAARGKQSDAVIAGPADQPEIAVYVFDPDAESKLHDPTIDQADQYPVLRIGPGDLVPVDYIDIVGHHRDQSFHLPHVVLSISVGVKDQIFRRAGEPGAQR